MSEPIISYSAKLAKYQTYKDVDEIFGGTYTNSDPIEIDLRIWNNRFGTETVDDLQNFVINFYFDKLEDNNLLQYITINYNGVEEVPVSINNNIGTASFLNNVIIKGTPNDGSDNNLNNYINLKIIFNITDENVSLKNNDFKSLYLDIVKQ